MSAPPALQRLYAHWVYGGALAGLLLLALAPLCTEGWPGAMVLVFLALPAYMLHQYEEHADDRFRRFVGDLAGNPEALSLGDVFWINIVGVWAVLAGVLWLALRVDAGWGLAAGWLVLINAAAHLGQGLALRRYNPGLGTAIALFVPLGAALVACLWAEASPAQLWLTPLAVLALHAAILLRVRVNLGKPRA